MRLQTYRKVSISLDPQLSLLAAYTAQQVVVDENHLILWYFCGSAIFFFNIKIFC